MDCQKFTITEERQSEIRNFVLQMLDKKGKTDIPLFGENTDDCLVAHKHILSNRSRLFADVISKQQNNDLHAIIVQGVPPWILILVLCYMYSDEIKTDSPKELIEIGKAAKLLEMSDLIRSCKHRLSCCSIDKHNVWAVIEASKFFKLEALGKKCLRFLNLLFSDTFFEMPGFLQTKQDTLHYILKFRDFSSKSEAFWMEGIIRWLQHQKSRNKSLLSIIQTFSLTSNEFLDLIEKYPTFFTSKEISRVLCNMLRPGMADLPSWCEAETVTNKIQPISNYNDVAANSLKIKLECNRRFLKSYFYEEDGFEASIVFEIKLAKHFSKLPHLVMLELAFGSTYIPIENLDLELHYYDSSLAKTKIKFSVNATEEHYYLILKNQIRLQKNNPLIFTLKLRASGLKNWGTDGPVSNRQYRVAKIPEDIFQNICLDIDGSKSICLTLLSDWMIFIDPKCNRKNLVLTSFYFDSNHQILGTKLIMD